jgi:thiol-disulfide isomerase/thioredoxin
MAVALSVSAFAAMPVPRQSKEFTFVQPGGKQTLLSSYKGKVVCIQFLYTTCPHCQALSRVLTKMSGELGPNVQFLGVAFDEENPQLASANIQGYIKQQGVSFPVAFASRDTVMSYLGLSVMDRFVVPQMAIIDKKGVIRAQSAAMGTETLQREDTLMPLLKGLVAESATGGATTSKTPAKPAEKTPTTPAPPQKKAT